MYRPSNKMLRLATAALTLAALPALASPSHARRQESEGTAVPILQTTTSRNCADISEVVVDEETFGKLASTEKCAFLKKLDIDFSTQTLMVVTVRGDCFVRASVELSRDDAAKKYTCHIKRVFGGCRAAGRFERWVVVEKLRPGYELEFVTTTRERGEPEQGR